jgi:mannose-1-phosphate guanylyltransferase
VNEVVLAVNYQPAEMERVMKEWEKKLNIKITYSQETEPLGTAGPLALAREHLNDGEPFFVLNSDVICPFPFTQMLAFHKAHG